jgi:transposase
MGTKLLYPHLPAAETLIADKGYDSDEFRDALATKGITPCIPSRPNRIADIIYDNGPYKTRGRIEIMFGRLKDWRPALLCATTVPPTRSSRRYVLRLPSSSGSDQ